MAVAQPVEPVITSITSMDAFNLSGEGGEQSAVAQGGWAQMWGTGLDDGFGNFRVFINGVEGLVGRFGTTGTSNIAFQIPAQTPVDSRCK